MTCIEEWAWIDVHAAARALDVTEDDVRALCQIGALRCRFEYAVGPDDDGLRVLVIP